MAKLTKEQRQALKNRKTQAWRFSIVEHLKANGPCDDLSLYNATRPDRLQIPDAKKIHNIASQLNYLSNEDYIIIKDNDKRVLVADPEDNVYVDDISKYI